MPVISLTSKGSLGDGRDFPIVTKDFIATLTPTSFKTHRNPDTNIIKPTHTDRYLQFDSHDPKYHKLAVAKTLHNKINTHVTNNDDKATLHKQIQYTLTLNGFSCLALKEKPRRPTKSFKSFTSLSYIHVQQIKFNVF